MLSRLVLRKKQKNCILKQTDADSHLTESQAYFTKMITAIENKEEKEKNITQDITTNLGDLKITFSNVTSI